MLDFLEVAHALTRNDLSARYERDNPNRIFLRLHGGIEQFTTLIECTIIINNHSVSPVGTHNLFECWTLWPLLVNVAGLTYHSIVVQELGASIEGNNITKLVHVIRNQDKGVTRFCLEPDGRDFKGLPIEITFKALNVFYSLPGPRPFAHKLLSFNIELQQPASRSKAPTIVYLEHPESIALRVRVDESEYHSLALGLPDGYQRKTSFFPSQHIDMQYRFGVTDASELRSSGWVMLNTGLGILSSGFALQLADQYESCAAVILGVALILPYREALHRIRLFFPSSDVRHPTSEGKAVRLSVVLYLLTVPAAIMTLGWFSKAHTTFPSWWGWLSQWRIAFVTECWAIGVGLFLIGWAGWRLLATQWGVLQKYACDRCVERIPLRRFREKRFGFYTRKSRRTLCYKCWLEVTNLGSPEVPIKEAKEKVLAW